MILRGFILTYRGSPEIFGQVKHRLEGCLNQMEPATLAFISKAYHITENDDKRFEKLIEAYVL